MKSRSPAELTVQVRKVIVTAPQNGALLLTGRLIQRELKVQIHEEATTERLISHAISDPSVKGGAEGAVTMAGATGVGVTGVGVTGVGATEVGVIGVGVTGAGTTGAEAVVAPGVVEGMARGIPSHLLTATHFSVTRLRRSKWLLNPLFLLSNSLLERNGTGLKMNPREAAHGNDLLLLT